MEAPPHKIELDSRRSVLEHVFHFGERHISAKLIACPHDSEEDKEFIKTAIGSAHELRGKTIYIEQGSSNNQGNILGELKHIASGDPVIAADLKKRAETRWSTLSDAFEQREVFAAISNYVLEVGAEVVNMDASMNSSPEVFEFFLNEDVSEEFVIEIFYGAIRNTTCAEEEMVPKLLTKLLPFSENKIREVSKRLYRFYHDGTDMQSIDSIKRLLSIRDYWDYLREKFMFETLQKKLKDGDIVIAHPLHVDAILRHSEIKIEKPPVPELL